MIIAIRGSKVKDYFEWYYSRRNEGNLSERRGREDNTRGTCSRGTNTRIKGRK